MTIAAYLQQIEQASASLTPGNPKQGSFADCMKEATDIWSNNACKGYAISAAIAAGLDERQTGRLIDALRAAFEEMTVDEAEKFYQDGEY
jgi:hypothetical protein